MTVRLWVVRHGEPLEAVGIDPGLSARGHEQAAALVEHFAARGPMSLRTSPLRRARETAAALEAAWGTPAGVDPVFRELPSSDPDPVARRAWLRRALAGTFAELGPEQRAWRDAIVAAAGAVQVDTVIATHAVVINALTAACDGTDAVLGWVPAHGSVTELAVDATGALTLVARGAARAGGDVLA